MTDNFSLLDDASVIASENDSESPAARRVGLGAMMTGGARVVQRDRRDRDHYPTPVEVTRALMRRHPELGQMTIWEPCCAEGLMADVFEEFGARTVRSDIHPMCPTGFVQDFLAADRLPDGVDAIISNPPYKLAPEFIAKAITLRPRVIGMFLKSSFWHAKRRQALFESCPPSYIAALTWRPDFLGLGAPAMDFIWTTWFLDQPGPTIYELMSKPG